MCYDLPRVRILLDYRSALRRRTGVGEFAHRLATALAALLPLSDTLTLFSSSWKDRLPPDAVLGTTIVDARVPVSLLNLAWHRLGWPPVEVLAGPVDVTHSLHPLMMPTRSGARFITIHDLFFLDHPERTSAEIRRDYGRLAADHARQADVIVVNSEYTRAVVVERLAVDAERTVLCYPGAPDWQPRREPAVPGPILFVGTIEPRKNLGGLLEAFAMLADELGPAVPDLIVAGRLPAAGSADASVIASTRTDVASHVRYLDYIDDEQRLQLYREASMLVIPSLDEGFGLPALEAMTVGLPVVAARRGSLPEVLGEAALFVEPDDPIDIAAKMKQVLAETGLQTRLTAAGIARAQGFRWAEGAARVYEAYKAATARPRRQR
jgi:glycosyltransferase involved in cell wall biosynthesis